jgi:hypothetical protein
MATSWSVPTTLNPALNDREGALDALYRAVGAFDQADDALLRSAFVDDAKFKLDDFVMDGLEEIKAKSYDNVSKLDTTHFITNPRVHVGEDGQTAKVSANALAQHYRPGTGKSGNSPRFLTGSFYLLDVAKQGDGLWKVTKWDMKVVWTEGDMKVLTG